METRKIGSLDVSVVGLGTNNFGMRLDETRSAAVIHAALDAGVNFIDTADVYGGTRSEEFIGNTLKGHRDEVVLATKFGMKLDDDHLGGASPAYVRSAVEDSLRRLATDRIDLYILHRPDPATSIADTLEALDELVQEGKVIEIGASNFSAEQLQEAEEAAKRTRFVNLQNQYSVLQRSVEREVLPECERTGVGFVPFSPLASGLLTGKYHRNEEPPAGTRMASMPEERRNALFTEKNFDTVEALSDFCEQRGQTLLDLAMSWLLTRPAVSSVIAGATTPEQLAENVAAAEWELTRDDLANIDDIAPIG
jgi:aryl-alcohol dehydrogenase-like predicted oxidoreductase